MHGAASPGSDSIGAMEPRKLNLPSSSLPNEESVAERYSSADHNASDYTVDPIPWDVDASFARVLQRAIEVIGNRDESLRWLGSPIRALDLATPISLLRSQNDVDSVLDVLGQMQHGIW